MKVYFEEIYEHIGYLFYALASEKARLTQTSYGRLVELVDGQWDPGARLDYPLQSHLVDYLHSGLRNAMDSSLQAEEAFDRFCSYYELHRRPFGKELLAKIVNTGNLIITEFLGDRTSSGYIAKAENLFALKRSLPST